MDGLKAHLMSYSIEPSLLASDNQDYDKKTKTYVSFLTKLPKSVRETILLHPVESLQILDPTANSLGYLTVLETLLEATTAKPEIDSTTLRDFVLRFLLKFNPIQIRYAGLAFRKLLEQVPSLFPPVVAVELLAEALLRIDPSGSMFTSIHLITLRLAYDANCLEPALKIIDRDILVYPQPPITRSETRRLCEINLEPSYYITAMGLADGIKTTTVLEYHFFRSLIYLSRRDWSKAQFALEQIIAHPTKDKGVSKFMTESHKKWVLVGLLNEGKAPSHPSSVKAYTKSAYSALSSPYNSIAALFTSDEASKLKEECEKGRQTWDDDGNSLLVEEVMSAYQKWQIINLRLVYRQVSISQIRVTTLSAQTGEVLKNDQETLTLVSDMIQSGMLKGELQIGATAEDSYLTFHEEHDLMTEAKFAEEIALSHHNIESLGKQFRFTNERLSANKDYARHLVREKKLMEKDGTDAGIGFSAHIEDEDLMTGVMSHA